MRTGHSFLPTENGSHINPTSPADMRFTSSLSLARETTYSCQRMVALKYAGKRLDVNLISAGLVGLICDPFSVGRKLCPVLIEFCVENWKWFPGASAHWQCPDV